MNWVCGIDLGGTKIEGVMLASSRNVEVLSRLRIPTEAEQGYEHILQQIKTLFDRLIRESDKKPHAIGIGTPGTMDPETRLIKNSNTTCLNGKPFKSDLEALLQIPVKIANDANCFALAETLMGAVPSKYPQAKVVFGTIMGTGVGGGLVVDKQVIHGKQGNGGEWGHNFLDESGGNCYCGKTGCVETVISGPALERFYYGLSGKNLQLPDIVSLYQHGGDPYATTTINRLINKFGEAISVVINLIDPDVIVLGGGLSNIELLHTKGREAVKKFLFNDRLDTVFLKPELGDSAGVFGAALLNS